MGSTRAVSFNNASIGGKMFNTIQSCQRIRNANTWIHCYCTCNSFLGVFKQSFVKSQVPEWVMSVHFFALNSLQIARMNWLSRSDLPHLSQFVVDYFSNRILSKICWFGLMFFLLNQMAIDLLEDSNHVASNIIIQVRRYLKRTSLVVKSDRRRINRRNERKRKET